MKDMFFLHGPISVRLIIIPSVNHNQAFFVISTNQLIMERTKLPATPSLYSKTNLPNLKRLQYQIT